MELKKCPFCGSDAAYLFQKSTRYGFIVYVQCQICGAQTKVIGSREDAAEVDWNTDACVSVMRLWNTRNARDGG